MKRSTLEWVAGDPRAAAALVARLRAENQHLKKFVRSMALDPDENMHPDVFDHALITQGLARDCLKRTKAKR